MSLQPGQPFGKYEIIELLGRGGMGEVYLAKDRRLNRQVAIKVISPELAETRELLLRFRKEASLAATLNHPNICTIYEAGEVNAQTYICMEYVEGKTLRNRIAGEPMALSEILDISIQIADALEEARKKNIIHRDIKSANILLTDSGRVKILDFGLAKQLKQIAGGASSALTESSVTQTGNVRGTAAYMSPEQALGKEIDHRSDIFSFGVVLYEMLTGRLPFSGNSSTEVVDAILHKVPTPVTRYNDSVPPDMTRLVNKMLEKDPDLRYQSVHEVWSDLRHVRGDTTGPGTRPDWIKKPRTSIPRTAVIAAILILAVLSAGVFYFIQRKQNAAPSAGATAQEKRVAIAVLPFRYTGDDPTRQYLGTLVTDGLIAGLQPIPGLSVVPYATIKQLGSASVQEIVRELGVRWIIKGIVSVNGDNTDITPEIIAADGKEVWKQTLSGRPVNVPDMAKKQILKVLNLKDTGTRDLEQLRTPSVEAYKKYLEARNLAEGWDIESNLEAAIAGYQESIAKDPDFAAARAGLAMALMRQFHLKHDPALLSQAGEEARRALGLDSNLPESLLAFGMIQAESGNSIEARDAFSKALELAPGNDSACISFGNMYSALGRNKEAEEMYKQAVALRPSFWRNHQALGTFEWQFAGNLDEARAHLQKASELHPEGYAPLVVLGIIDLTQGNLDSAESYFRKALERSPNSSSYNNLGLVYYYRGQYDLALRNWQAVLKDAPENPAYEANVADALRQLGRNADANAHYEKVIGQFRADVKANPSDDKNLASLAMALAATGKCKEASQQTRDVLTRHPDSPELNAYSAITVSRCGDINWAKQIVMNSIAGDNLLIIRFDPDLKTIRELPEIKQALKRVETTVSAAHQ